MTKKFDKLTRDTARQAAPVLYVARKERRVNPDGHFDGAGRWYPCPDEDADHFTLGIREPTRKWPYSYMSSARTRFHCELLAEFNALFAIKLASELPEFKPVYEAYRAATEKRVDNNRKRRERRVANREAMVELLAAVSTAFPA